ncbi:MAG: thiol:disulfide interchange protein TrxA [Cyanobacteriota bacterium]|jgi:thiol-disulfide isomerase/thioredoxin
MTLPKLRNLILALVAIALSVAIYFGFQTQAQGTSLEVQAKQSMPLVTALDNHQPTLVEFYANWCTTCQAMAKDLAQLKKRYGTQVNFVMLNVDNNKWLPEVLRYRVDGIPHFVYLNETGTAIGESIGEQPLTIMEENLLALLAHAPLPNGKQIGQTSALETGALSPDPTTPRSHGGQRPNSP